MNKTIVKYRSVKPLRDNDYKTQLARGYSNVPKNTEIIYKGRYDNFYGIWAEVEWNGHIYYVYPEDVEKVTLTIETDKEPFIGCKINHKEFGEVTLTGEIALITDSTPFKSGFWLGVKTSGEPILVNPSEYKEFYKTIDEKSENLQNTVDYDPFITYLKYHR